MIYLGGFFVFYQHGQEEELARRAYGNQRELGVKACQAELQNAEAEYVADSLLIESGQINQHLLRDFLGYRGLKFVEMKARALPLRGQQGDAVEWGITSFLGESAYRYLAPKDVNYIRISLTTKNDPKCELKALGLDFGSPSVPFSPDACLKLESSPTSEASHAIKAIPIENQPGYIRWSLIDQRTNKTLLGLASLNVSEGIIRGDTTDEKLKKHSKTGTLNCLNPHDSLMTLVRSDPPTSTAMRLALMRRVVDAAAIEADVEPNGWPEILGNEVAISDSDWGSKNSEHRLRSPWGSDWEEAFRSAERSGWSSTSAGLIDFSAGELVELKVPKYRNEWLRGYTAGSKDGFVFVASLGRHISNGVLMARYALSGELVWRGVLRSKTTHPENIGNLEPRGLELVDGVVRIYGFRYDKIAGQSSVVFVSVPFSEIGKGAN